MLGLGLVLCRVSGLSSFGIKGEPETRRLLLRNPDDKDQELGLRILGFGRLGFKAL